jgi:hypothetical protein
MQPVNDGARTFALEHRNLLSEGEDFESFTLRTLLSAHLASHVLLHAVLDDFLALHPRLWVTSG